MASIARGESVSAANPILDIFTVIGFPATVIDVAVLEFRILDISTDAKKVTPVQVYPAGIGTFQPLDPVNAPPTGHRLGVGHYFAEWTVPLDEAIGDHRIEWQFKLNALSPYEALSEEFYVLGASVPALTTYCGISDIRNEGYTDTTEYPDSRIQMLINLASRWVDKWTGRWFYPQTFDENNPMIVEGAFSRSIHLEIPIIELTRLQIENQGTVNAQLTEITLSEVRVYNRHIRLGLLQPDDRENPKIAFIQNRIPEIVKTGLFPEPLVFAKGRLNVYLEGTFGYTDPDGTQYGKTPEAIKWATCMLVIRELRLESDACEKLNDLNRFRIVMDKEGSTTVRLQPLWLKGAFTGDPRIDNIIMMYKRPPRIAVV